MKWSFRNKKLGFGKKNLLRGLRSWVVLLPILLLPFLAQADQSGSSNTGSRGVFGETVQGWTDSRTGAAQASYGFNLLPARGAIQPELHLSYNSSSSIREAGVGWGVEGLPVIELSSPRGGAPSGDPGGSWDARYSFNGQPLIPISSGSDLAVTLADGTVEQLPTWSQGWAYYRLQNDASHLRFFLSPQLQLTWRIQAPSGEITELGQPLAHPTGVAGAIELLPSGQPFRWRIILRYDDHCGANSPCNVVRYDWSTLGHRSNILLPVDVWDTLDAGGKFAHKTHIVYEANDSASRDLATISQAPIWGAKPGLRIKTVEVGGNGHDSSKETSVVRRYQLVYKTLHHRSFLHSITEEGASCGAVTCPTLPPTTFEYTEPPDTFEFRQMITPQQPSAKAVTPSDRPPTQRMPFEALNALGFVDVDRDGVADIVQVRQDPEQFDDVNRIYFTHVKTHPLGPPDISLEQKSLDTSKISDSQDVLSTYKGVTLVSSRDVWGAPSLFTRNGSLFNLGKIDLQRHFDPNTGFRWEFSPDGGAPFHPWMGNLFAIGDIDGNGAMDILSNFSGSDVYTYLYSRFRWSIYGYNPNEYGTYPDETGSIDYLPGSNTIPLAPTARASSDEPTYSFRYDKDIPFHALADMNGDGFADLVTLAGSPYSSQQPFVYYPGNGHGEFLCDRSTSICTVPLPCTNHDGPTTGCDTPWVALGGAAPVYPQSVPEASLGIMMIDVNMDGLADIVRPEFGSAPPYNTILHVWINDDGVNFHQEADLFDPLYGGIHVSAADMDGNGTNDLILVGPDQIGYFSRFSHQYPGLLKTIDNGVGGHTQFLYRGVAQLDQDASQVGNPWVTHSPQAAQVVIQVYHSQAGDVPGDNESNIRYTYRDPVYDPLEARLLGFQQIAEYHFDQVDSSNLNSYSLTTQYAFPCLLGPNDLCPKGSEVSDYRALTGVPFQVDVSNVTSSSGESEPKQYRSTTIYRYHNVVTHQESFGRDNGPNYLYRKVSFAYPDQVDTYLYEDAPFTPSPSPEVHSVPLARGGVPETRITLSSSNREHVRKEQDRDIWGNLLASRDFGRLGDNGQADPVITTSYDYERRGGDELYMFRVKHQTVTGFGNRPGLPADSDRKVEFVYNDPNNVGAVTDVVGTLSGTIPLARSHETGAEVAPPPPGASTDGAVALAHFDYDSYGNVIKAHGPNQTACVSNDYDTSYHHLLLKTRRYRDGCVEASALNEETRKFDDRFDTPRVIFREDGSTAIFDYDVFGRIASTADNDPDAVGMPSSDASQFGYATDATKATQAVSIKEPTSPGQSRTSWQYFNAFGQRKASIVQADAADGQGAPWVVEGATKQYLGAGPFALYRPYGMTTPPSQLALAMPAGVDVAIQYALGRVTERSDRGRRVQFRYHALSVDVYDEEDLGTGAHTNTPTTLTYDGHGRLIRATTRNSSAGGMDIVDTGYDYNAAGQQVRISKTHSLGSDVFTRWMQYDSLGRLVLNAEPNTSKGFVANPQDAGAGSTMRAWRYAYDDAARLVGTSDARGCGKNLFYDGIGRLLAEDYSPCLAHHEKYTPVDLAAGTGAEALYQYDAQGLLPSLAPVGRLTAVADRGAITHFGYDARGRTTGLARRIARPASDGPLLDLDFGGLDIELGIGIHIQIGGGGGDPGGGTSGRDRYASHLFRKAMRYDLANRLVSEDTGADVDDLLENGQSSVDYSYSARGFINAISSSYGPLISSIVYNVDGTRDLTAYGDAAHTNVKAWYGDHDILRYLVSRAPPDFWKQQTSDYTPADPNVPSSLQTVLADLQFAYDGVGNPTAIMDGRDPNEWPAGARPKSVQTLMYDDLYRLTSEQVEYNAPNKVDDQVSPFAEEEGDFTSPVVPRLVRAKRSTGFNVSYDFTGNTTSINDNDSTVFDRSALGTVTNGDAEGHPNRLAASSLGVQVHYDDAGNVVEMLVPRTGECTAFAGKCSHHFMYDWDEVGQLVRARRWDYETIPSDEPQYPDVPFFTADVDVRYAYSQGQRVLKSVQGRRFFEHHTAEIFNTLRVDNADWFFDDYDVSAATESAYLGGAAHVVVTEDNLPAMSSARRHVFLTIGDKLGSTNAVIDRDTGELAEDVQYHPYGTVDSDYRPERWGSHREVDQFTGKESDTEVGLTYFGARYYSPSIARWMSADPLTTHTGGGDLNPYAYVNGSPLRYTDPLGLCGYDDHAGPCLPPISPIPDPGGGGGDGGGGGIPKGSGPVQSHGTLQPWSPKGGGQGGTYGGSGATSIDPIPDGPAQELDTMGTPTNYQPVPKMSLNELYADKYGGETARRALFDKRFGRFAQAASIGLTLLNPGAGAARWFIGTGPARGALEGITADSAYNAANGPRLARQLAGESASSMFTTTGELTPDAIQGATKIIDGTKLGNQALVRELTKDGGNIADWGKYSTDTFRTPSGPAQVHFYYNSSTGAADYTFDFKTIFNNQGAW